MRTALKKEPKAAYPFSLPTALMCHNANILMTLIELAISRQQVLGSLAGASVVWGIYFVAFPWALGHRHRMFFYFFLDTTLPLKYSVPLHVVLASTLAIFSALGAAISTLFQGRALYERLALALALCLTLTRLRVYPRGTSAEMS